MVHELAFRAPERLDDSHRGVPGIADDRHRDRDYTPLATLATAEPEPVLLVVDADNFAPAELLAVHPAATNENAAAVPISANR